jgi:prepilin-type N-terminal cleavage/methylation domain-containing protein
MPRLRRRIASNEREQGFSLVELTVSMTIFGGLMAIIMAVFISSLNQSKDALARAESADSARLAISQLDSQIRSGSVIDDPALENFSSTGVPAGYSVRILTERGGVRNCVQWRVLLGGDKRGSLDFRTWPAWHPEDVSEWSQVATGLVGPETPYDAGDASTHKPFVLVTPSTGDSVIKSLAITLRVKSTGTREEGKAVLVSTTVTGRNTIFGRGGLECDNVPAA